MGLPNDWIKIEDNNKFTFWIPPGLREAKIHPIDSHLRRWESENLVVQFDYGQFSDPLTLYSRKGQYKTTNDQISNYAANIISFQRDSGWHFNGAHFPDLGKDSYGHVIKITLTVESGPEVDRELPLKIVRSIRFR
jgi:hypothetical protein